MKRVVEVTGKIDVLINNAAYSCAKALENCSYEDWRKGIDGTINGVFRVTRCVLPHMLSMRAGNVINISSMYGMVAPDMRIYGDSGQNNPASYGAGKAAIIQFTKYLAAVYADRGIRANAVSPGPFPHPSVQQNTQFTEELRKKNPQHRIGVPADLHGVISMVKSVGIIVQAHMGSTRLKNKMLKQLCGKSVLAHVVDRLKKVDYASRLIVATSTLIEDDVLVEECAQHNVATFRGSDSDVLARFYHCAKHYELSHIARVCADNTLVDWDIIDSEIELYNENDCDIVSTGTTIPLGLGCEIFSFDSLRRAFEFADKHYQREHVTPYIYESAQKIYRYELKKNFGKYRFTLDTQEDWELISKIYNELYDGEANFGLPEIIEVMDKHPDWFYINKDVQ